LSLRLVVYNLRSVLLATQLGNAMPLLFATLCDLTSSDRLRLYLRVTLSRLVASHLIETRKQDLQVDWLDRH
jgi:hypothetical protein